MLISKSVVKKLYLQPFSKYFHWTAGYFTNSWPHCGINQWDRRYGGQIRNTYGFWERTDENWNTIICYHTYQNTGFQMMYHSMQIKNESPALLVPSVGNELQWCWLLDVSGTRSEGILIIMSNLEEEQNHNLSVAETVAQQHCYSLREIAK